MALRPAPLQIAKRWNHSLPTNWQPILDCFLLEARKINPVTGVQLYSPREIQARFAINSRVYVSVGWINERTVWLYGRHYRVLPEYQGFDRVCAWLETVDLSGTVLEPGNLTGCTQLYSSIVAKPARRP